MAEGPTVWIVNDAGHPYEKVYNLLGADVTLRSLTLDKTNPLRVDRLVRHLARGIVQYAKSSDYLLISGTPMVNALAVLLWVKFFKRAQILQWNAVKREYELSTIEEDNVVNQLEKAMIR